MEKMVKDIVIPIDRYLTIPAGSSVKEALDLLRKSMESSGNGKQFSGRNSGP